MKNVRVFFSKKGRLKFISHLDMNRFFTRVLRKSGLPIWYTEGFNPHPYLTFALPLSLGFESEYEILDFRLTDDSFPLSEVEGKLSPVLPQDIKIIRVAEPVMKPGKISAAGFELGFENADIAERFEVYLRSGNVVVTKKTKKGSIKVEEVSSKIMKAERKKDKVALVLPAGNDNLNPSLLVASFAEREGQKVYVDYLRTAVYGAEDQLFI